METKISNMVPVAVKEFVGSLSDDDLKFYHMRLDQSFYGDIAEVLDELQEETSVDDWLKSAGCVDEFYHLVDLLFQQLDIEISRRNM
jgi:hypothetical protein